MSPHQSIKPRTGPHGSLAPAPCSAFLWAWTLGMLHVLVPKQRGIGWLLVPAGHHASPKIRDIETAAGCDVFGLDGTLDFDCGMDIGVYRDQRRAFEDRVFPAIERAFCCLRGQEVSLDRIEAEMKRPNSGNEQTKAV